MRLGSSTTRDRSHGGSPTVISKLRAAQQPPGQPRTATARSSTRATVRCRENYTAVAHRGPKALDKEPLPAAPQRLAEGQDGSVARGDRHRADNGAVRSQGRAARLRQNSVPSAPDECRLKAIVNRAAVGTFPCHRGVAWRNQNAGATAPITKEVKHAVRPRSGR